MASKWRVRLSGTGGQGVIRAAMMLASAAIEDGFNATQSQAYGPESRGGSTRAEVNISEQRILYPKVDIPNVLLCMSPEAFTKYKDNIDSHGLLILDSDIGDWDMTSKVSTFSVPITDIAKDVVGNVMAANVVALGVIIGLTEMVSTESMLSVLETEFSAKLFAINSLAFEEGYKAGQKLKEEHI